MERTVCTPVRTSGLSANSSSTVNPTTVDGEEFLVYDNGVDSSNRMLVFGTESGLRHLARFDTWFMDGTFDVAPLLFNQLYIIRASLGNTAVTCVYAFLPNKHQETYVELFTAVQDKCKEFGFDVDPSVVTVDFEQAVINTIKASFGSHITIHGCF